MRIQRLLAAIVAAILLSGAAPRVAADPTPPAKQPLDNPLEKLTPKEGRSQAEEDRLAVLAIFGRANVGTKAAIAGSAARI